MAKQAWQDGWVVVPTVRGLRETVYGVKTHYVHAGEGEPVVLVHGGGPGASGASGWSNTIPVLAEHYHVYAIDLIGFGHTDKPLVDYSFQTYVEHVAGFVDALNLNNIRICGNSQGAYVAMKYVLDNPGRVQRVALISTGTLAGACGLRDTGRGVVELPRFDGTKESLRRFMQIIVNDPAKLTDELIDSRFAVASLPGHREMMDSIAAYRKLMASDSSYRQVYDVRARLPLLTIPWCMIWGGDDRSAPLDPLGLGMHEMFPNVPFHMVEGSGHQVQNDKPEECNRLLLEAFGASVGAGAGT
ncbi:MAG TPA: alpha/beta fold hydrolase [Chloroflexota bacterium]|nr:alpha/beta fold hydrolase [Chloroflexota bacterium]